MDNLQFLLEYISTVTPAQFCQSYYIFASTCILTITFLPKWLRSALMDYGPRQQRTPASEDSRSKEKKKKNSQKKESPENQLTWLIHALEVPHSWFQHFYVLSFGLSIFWGYQYLTRGSVMEFLVKAQVKDGNKGVDLGRTFVAWALLLCQGARRLYESLAVQNKGKSAMSSIHWVVALVYYGCMSVSIWIEGSDAILRAWETGRILPSPPSRTVGLATAVFVLASYKQSQCHGHLASLKKYTLPTEGWFCHIVCPHYTAECLIYLSLSFVAAPQGKAANQTVFLGLVFVAVNLGTTAAGTKRWYSAKFGKENVKERWRMIPFVF